MPPPIRRRDRSRFDEESETTTLYVPVVSLVTALPLFVTVNASFAPSVTLSVPARLLFATGGSAILGVEGALDTGGTGIRIGGAGGGGGGMAGALPAAKLAVRLGCMSQW